MKKLSLYIIISIFGTFKMIGSPVELINIDFTKDSTQWKTQFPEPAWNASNTDYTATINNQQIGDYLFKGTYGKFNSGVGVRAQPIRNDAQNSRRRWAFRIDNNGTSYLKLPPLSSAGKFIVWCKNGSQTDEGVLYIQKLVDSTWTTIRNIYVPPHYDKDYEHQVEEYLNIPTGVTLRIFGATKNIHVYKIAVNEYDAAEPKKKPFKLILIPDPQNYANNSNYTHIYGKQMIWVANNSDSIKFVLCLGDMTQLNSDEHWSIAAGAFTIFEGKKVPFTFTPGNHDLGSTTNANNRNSTMLNKYMPYSRYSRQPSFGGVYEANKMENSWSTFTHDDYKFLILSLEYAVRNKVLDWAATVIDSHPDYNVIINTHAFIGQDNKPLSGRWENGISQATGVDYSNDAQEMWDKRFKMHKNILFIFSGHILGTGIGHRDTRGVNGNMVYQFAANYQTGVKDSEKGGNGFLRILDIDPERHSLKIQTYSPFLNQYNTAAGQTFNYTNIQYIKDSPSKLENQLSGKIKIWVEGKNLRIINENTGMLSISIYNLQGVKILQQSAMNIDNLRLPVSGCYIVSVREGNNDEIVRQKIIIP